MITDYISDGNHVMLLLRKASMFLCCTGALYLKSQPRFRIRTVRHFAVPGVLYIVILDAIFS